MTLHQSICLLESFEHIYNKFLLFKKYDGIINDYRPNHRMDLSLYQ